LSCKNHLKPKYPRCPNYTPSEKELKRIEKKYGKNSDVYRVHIKGEFIIGVDKGSPGGDKTIIPKKEAL